MLNTLKAQRPEFLKQFYDQAKLAESSMSEVQVSSYYEYELHRLDTKLWTIMEKDRKKRQRAKMQAKRLGKE